MSVLLMLRHGESTANADDVFGGWLDYPLTPRGREQARNAGRLIHAAALDPAAVHTSLLARAVDTADAVLAETAAPVREVARSWRLNERHYGAFQGRSRGSVRAEFGDESFERWRRSYDAAPPAIADDHPANSQHDARYAAIADCEVPVTESLADVRRRLLPYWHESIVPDLTADRITLVVAHGNSLRALCMYLDDLSEDQVRSLHIPTGVPLRYDLDEKLVPRLSGGEYLDPTSAALGIAEVTAAGTRRVDP
ncbi:2,3-diphosphoglycerate-dependent phosphoglycerate mutase [Mycobacterium sp. URHB0044]|uniref:2,3-bisphosphoglycerate-dependent phosphoglycerate mutase n=1 Tax=Mycobacterium sp. URHB0044 TaxID=1380386 RepID=UPI000490CF73|nr:2,3-bisphosphoglycerate-dependent phosphoglycerate mutase [Mycobacterium sp. URHB0044]